MSYLHTVSIARIRHAPCLRTSLCLRYGFASFEDVPYLCVAVDVIAATWSGADGWFLRNTFDFSPVLDPSCFGPKPWSCWTIVSCPLSRV